MQFSLALESSKWSLKISQTTSFDSPASRGVGHININSQFPDVSYASQWYVRYDIHIFLITPPTE